MLTSTVRGACGCVDQMRGGMGPPPMMMGGPPGANNYFNLPPPMMGMIAPPGTHPPTLPTPPLAACSASLAGEHGWLEQRAWLVVQHPNPYLDTLRSLGRGPCTSRRDAAARHDAADGARRVAHLLPVDEPKHDGKLSGAAAAGRPWPWRRAAAVRSSVPRRVCVCVCVCVCCYSTIRHQTFLPSCRGICSVGVGY